MCRQGGGGQENHESCENDMHIPSLAPRIRRGPITLRISSRLTGCQRLQEDSLIQERQKPVRAACGRVFSDWRNASKSVNSDFVKLSSKPSGINDTLERCSDLILLRGIRTSPSGPVTSTTASDVW